ncbi:MAG: hypothetical protein LCH39_04520 [Proteobacteria bacterium]|nr:hypothetical protein [Pseudomonadota bacterium]
MKRLAIATCLLASAAAANALIVLRPQATLEPLAGETKVELGGHRLLVPRALIRDHAQMQGGRLDRLDLVMLAEGLAPLPPVDAKRPEAAPPERVALVLTPSDDRLSSIDMFGKVYARFLSGETMPTPSGLMLRRFREKTPYEDRELYLGVGTGRTFVALCPLPEAQAKEPCTTTFRLAGLDMELRFSAARLPQWRRMTEHAFSLMEEMTREQVEANRIPLPPENPGG